MTFKKTDSIFLISILVLMLVSTAYAAESEAPNKTAQAKPATAIAAKQDPSEKCFFDTAGGLIARLTLGVEEFEKTCKLEQKKDLNVFIKALKQMADFEALPDGKLPLARSKEIDTFIAKYKAQYSFVTDLVDLKKLKSDGRSNAATHEANEIWEKAIKVINQISKKNDFPDFFRHNLINYTKHLRQLTILRKKYAGKETKCIRVDDDGIVLHVNELFYDPQDPSFNPNQSKCGGKDSLTIDPLDIERGGWTVTFWIYENIKSIKKKTTAFQGFLNNKLLYHIDLFNKDNRVAHDIQFGSFKKELVSKSPCADMAFVYISFGKDCDKYRLHISFRFLASNQRVSYSVDLKPEEVENVKIKILGPIANDKRSYKGFDDSLSREKRLFAEGTTEARLAELKQNIKECKKKRENCDYTVKDKCANCNKGSYLHKGKCVNKCPDGTYLNKEKTKCNPCDKKCKKCFGEKNGQCSDCNDNLVLHQGKCSNLCPNGMAPEKDKNGVLVCHNCGLHCTSCKTPKECTKCDPKYYLLHGECVKDCTKGFYKRLVPNVCEKCKDECSKCEGEDDCGACKLGYFLYHGHCVKKCPKGYYADNNTLTCTKCVDHCEECNNQTSCNKCKKPFKLNHKGQCVTKCPEGTVDINGTCINCEKDCLQCDPLNAKSCKKCILKKVLKDGRCENDCGYHYFIDISRKCHKCKIPHCKICTEKHCKECENGKYLLGNTECVNTCPDGFIAVGGACIPCKNKFCRKCSTNLKDCTSCTKGRVLLDIKCVEKCPKGYFLRQGKCQKCMPGCQHCKDDKSCGECEKGWVRKGNFCVKNCGEGWVLKNGVCHKCLVSGCDQCKTDKLDICTKCRKGEVLYNNKCYKYCPGKTFQSGVKCNNCKKNCLKCKNEKDCQRCIPPKVLQGNSCENTCDDGYVNFEGFCLPCFDKSCKRCSLNRKKCTECKNGLIKFQGHCVLVCPAGFYAYKGECHKCSKTCGTCAGNPLNCTTCPKGFTFLVKNGKKICVDSCPIRTMKNVVKGTCDECTVKHCLKCAPVDKCIECEKGYYRFGANCYKNCPKGYFPKNKECHKCVDHCTDCTDSDHCKNCDKKYFLYDNNKECVNGCPKGYVEHKGVCVKCKGRCERCNPNKADQCTVCPVGTWLYHSSCVSHCPSGTYEDLHDRTCKSCKTANCLKCSSEDKGKTCYECTGKLLLENNKCVEKCSENYCKEKRKCVLSNHKHVKKCHNNIIDECVDGYWLVSGLECKNECPLGTFINHFTKTCDNCTANCDLCKDKNNCTRCRNGFYYYNKKCIKDCPKGYTPENGMCVRCVSAHCDLCTKSNTCNGCEKGYLLYKNQCVKTCPNGTFTFNGFCKECGDGCNKCKTNTKCNECKKPAILVNGKCVDKCPDGFVRVKGKCTKCIGDPDCIKCSPTDLSECIDCKGNNLFNIITKKCIKPPCPSGLYEKRDQCVPCSEGCQDCINDFSCKKCKKGFILFKNVCLKDCPETYEEVDGVCQKCSTNCSTCKNKKCIVCNKPYFRFNGRCVKNCDTGYFPRNGECNKCEDDCDECKDEKDCTKCSGIKILYNGDCIEKCPEGYHHNVEKRTCEKCVAFNCASCTRGKDQCDHCKGKRIVFNNKCYEKCPVGYYETKNHTCERCFSDCLDCNNDKECSRCEKGWYLTPDHKLCKKNCGTGFREIVRNGVGLCEKCVDDNCENCKADDETCNVCKSGFFLFDKKCVKVCPKGTYLSKDKKECKECDPTCEECQDSSSCKKCKKGFTLQGVNCKNKCDRGFADVNGVCQQCDCENCDSCSTTLNECYSCKPGYLLLKFVKDLTPGAKKTEKHKYQIKTQCVKKCPFGYTPTDGVCKKCSDYCNECENNQSCKTCIDGYLLLNGKCVERCPEGYNPEGLECKRCDDYNCANCNPKNTKECNGCLDKFFLKQGKCVPECGNGWFVQYTNKAMTRGTCKPCGANCDNCNSFENCSKCQDKFVLQEGECKEKCNIGWIVDAKGVCRKCKDIGCFSCSPKNLDECNRCLEGYFLLNGDCVKNCGSGYYENPNGECEKCVDANCNKCAPTDSCNTCKENFYLFNRKCHKECPDGYNHKNGRECEPCQSVGCKRCSINLTPCYECSFPKALYLGACVENCPLGFYRASNGNCEKCMNNCLSCREADKCDKCVKGFLLTLDLKCNDKCADGSAPNPLTSKCEPCKDGMCSKCTLDIPEDPSKEPTGMSVCNQCKPGIFMWSGKCVKVCPRGTYNHLGRCLPCNKGCGDCKKADECVECLPPLALFHADCVEKCPPGYANINGKCQKCLVCGCANCDGDIAKCKVCSGGDVMYHGKCYPKCPDGSFKFKEHCEDCIPECLDCDDEKSCNKCKQGFYIFENQCVPSCPEGYVPKDGRCYKCHNSRCATCTDPKSNKCVTCPNNYFFLDGDCYEKCPATFYPVFAPVKHCEKCETNCFECENNKKCRRCKKGFYLDGVICKSRCPPYKVASNGKCFNCTDKRCRTCTPSDFGKCQECDKGFFIFDHKCISKCPPGYFGNLKTGYCEKCQAHCTTCSDAKHCIDCENDYYFWRNSGECRKCEGDLNVIVKDSCFPCEAFGCSKCINHNTKKCERCEKKYVKFLGICKEHCPAGFFRVGQECHRCSSSCEQCTSEKSCQRCDKPFLLYNGLCIKKCPDGYAPVGGECRPCKQGACLICNPFNLGKCNKCKPGFLRYEGVCIKDCPDGTFMQEDTCIPCPDNCTKCNSMTCLECKAPRKLKGRECVLNCGVGFFDNINECIPCNTQNCDVCSPNTKCKKCHHKYFLFDNKCDQICPKGYFANIHTGECERCESTCEDCDAEKCNHCKKGYNLNLATRQCVGKCPKGFTPVNQVCTKCIDGDCDYCMPEKTDTCINCSPPHILFRGKCIKKCPEGYFQKNNTCEKCKKICKTCKNDHSCETCVNGFILFKDDCIDNCPEGMVLYKGKCLSCTDGNCKKCTVELNKCLDCKHPFNLYKEHCVTHCPKGYYPRNGQCVKCEAGCVDCKDKNHCSACEKGFYLFNGECVTSCTKGYWPNCNKNVCEKCDGACEACVDETNVCDCKTGYFSLNGKCTDPSHCPEGTFPDMKLKKCKKCTLEFCESCKDDKTCLRCIKGFTLEHGKCVEAKNPVQLFKGPQYYSTRTYLVSKTTEVYSFNSDIKGAFVGSDIISFSYWFRYLKQSLIDDFEIVVFQTETLKSPPIDQFKFTITGYLDPKRRSKCGVKAVTPTGKTFTLASIDCEFDDVDEWTFFYVSIHRKAKSEDGKIIIEYLNNKTHKFKRFTEPIIIKSDLVTKDTVIRFNGKERGDAYEFYNVNIYDFALTEFELLVASKGRPPRCDYGCSKCRGTCVKCHSGNPGKDGSCPPVYVPVKPGIADFDQGLEFRLWEKITKHFVSDRWAFTTWFFIDSDVEYVDLFYLQLTDNTEHWKINKFVTITVVKGVIHVNGVAQKTLTVRSGYWYAFLYTVEELTEYVSLMELDGKIISTTSKLTQYRRIYDDLTIWIGHKFTNQKTRHFKGAIYDAREYLNGSGKLRTHPRRIKKPDGCAKLGKNLKCAECIKGWTYNKVTGVCVDFGIVKNPRPIVLLQKESFWSFSQKVINLNEKALNNNFAITFWMRKKIHSSWKFKNPSYNFFSLADSKEENSSLPIVTATTIPGYKVTYNVFQTNQYTSTYFQGNYGWDYYVFNFDKEKKTVDFLVITSDKKTYSYTRTFKDAFNFNQIIFGDQSGVQLNYEIALVSYFRGNLNAGKIAKLHRKKPRDCSASCLNCNYYTGVCRLCKVHRINKGQKIGYNARVCTASLSGFVYSYLFGRSRYSDIPPSKNWIIDNDQFFKRDVNSNKYSVIGYYKILDLQKMFNEKGVYNVFNFGQNHLPNFVPGSSLISLNIGIKQGNAQFYFTVGQTETNLNIPVPEIKVSENKWYFIHAGVDVTKKKFDFLFMDPKNQKKKVYRSIKLNVFPERAQEISRLQLFGVGLRHGKDDSVTNGQFHKFYLSLDNAFSYSKVKKYLRLFKTPKPPKCPSKCVRCIGVSKNPERNTCLKCQSKYHRDEMDRCVRDIDLPKYNFLVLKSYHLSRNTNFKISKAPFSENNNVNVAFFLRKNYQPNNYLKERTFLHYGNLKVKLVSTDTKDFIIYHIEGHKKELKMPLKLLSGAWNKISFNISKHTLTAEVATRGGVRTQGVLKFPTVSWNNAKSIQFNVLSYEVNFYGIHLFNGDNLNHTLINYPSSSECPYDCRNCYKGSICKQCYYGKITKKNTCGQAAIWLWNAKVSAKTGTEHVQIADFLNKNKMYRTNRFAFVTQFSVNLAKAKARQTVFRINNLSGTSPDKNSIQHNALTLDYQAPNKFYLTYHNRDVKLATNAPINIPLVMKVPPQGNQFYILVNYDAKTKNEINVFIKNSGTYLLEQTIKIKGHSEYLTNNAHIHLGDSRGATSYFRFSRFYYESNKDKAWFLRHAKEYTGVNSKACKVGNMFICQKCASGSLQNGICLPDKNSENFYVSKEGNTQILHVSNGSQNQKISFDKRTKSLQSLTFQFYYRRTAFSKRPKGIFRLGNILEAYVQENNLFVQGNVGKGNKLILNNLYNNNNEKFNWIYITITYDIVHDKLSVYTITHHGKKTRTDTQSHTGTNKSKGVNFKDASFASFGYAIGKKKYFAPFDISGVTFSPNYIISNDNIFLHKLRAPLECSTPCSKNCSADLICPKVDRLKNQFSVSNIFLNNENKKKKANDLNVINSLPAFRSLSSIGTNLSKNLEFNFYLTSLGFNVKDLYNSNYRANSNVLFVVSNDPKAKKYKLGDKIPDSIVNYGLISIVENDGILRVYTGSNIFSQKTNFIDLNFNNRSIKNFSKIYISFLIDILQSNVKFILFADDLETSNVIHTEFLPGHVRTSTLFYNHPAITDVHLSIYNPRFYNDLTRNLYSSKNWTHYKPSNLCNLKGAENSCAKCIFKNGDLNLTCKTCVEGYKFVHGKCIQAYQNNEKWRDFNKGHK